MPDPPERARACLLMTCAPAARPRACLNIWCGSQARPRACLLISCAARARARACLLMTCEDLPRPRAALIMESTPAMRARACLLMTCARQGDSHLSPCLVYIEGQPVQPIAVSLTDDCDQVAITATLEFAAPLPDNLWPPAAISLDLLGQRYELLGESYSRTRRFGERGWTLVASSPAARLQSRYAEPVSGNLDGPASTLARQLAGPVPLVWTMVDWQVQPGRLSAAGQAPLELLRTLVSAAGGTLSSDPDGRLRAQVWPPYPPADWPTHRAATVDSLHHMIAVSDSEDSRDLYNAVTVSADAESTGASLRIEEDADQRVGTVTEVVVYQVPWRDEFDLRHCGKSLVVLADLGIEEREIIDELIEIQQGSGRTQYPIHGIVAARWNQIDLGSITPAEDGTLETAITGESLLYLSYKTRARRYRVDAGEIDPEPLLVVVEDT